MKIVKLHLLVSSLTCLFLAFASIATASDTPCTAKKLGTLAASAHDGDGAAMIDLANCYALSGNYKAYATWRDKAIEQGHTPSTESLFMIGANKARKYLYEGGWPVDEDLAIDNLTLIADGDPESCCHEAASYLLYEIYSRANNESKREQYVRQLEKHYPNDHDKNLLFSLAALKGILLTSYAVDYKLPESIKNFEDLRKAEALGDDMSKYFVSELRLKGSFGLSNNILKVIANFEKIAASESTAASFAAHRLGEIYNSPYTSIPSSSGPVNRNYEKALRYYKLAASLGNEDARDLINRIGQFEIADWNGSTSITGLVTDELAMTFLISEISYSESKRKSIWFSHGSSNVSLCDLEKTSEHEETIWLFGKQAVSMYKACKKNPYLESGTLGMIEATPKSDRGIEFIVNLFKKATKPVIVNDYEVSTKGFTKAWNDTSDNVL